MAAPEISYCLPFFLGLITAVRSFVRTLFKYRSQIEAPPSPPSLPLIGHLHLLGPVLPKPSQPIWSTHADTFRDIRVNIQDPWELNFISLPEFGCSEYFIYRGSRFVTAQYGDYWRFMKKLCMARVLSICPTT
ncbi:hypothetical protein NC651_025618 [Populus alba x Populus x berolinensis]|nr:hypothetical protein NC651_025618 [Populus alba x Populus x berolinensis]